MSRSIVSVEIKDAIVAKEVEDAIAREAAAEREKRARLKLAEAEELATDSMNKAAEKGHGMPSLTGVEGIRDLGQS